jgi:hypothetical protein
MSNGSTAVVLVDDRNFMAAKVQAPDPQTDDPRIGLQQLMSSTYDVL